MARRPLLKPDQWSELVGIPVKEDDVIRHYSLTQDDIDAISGKRGDHNRLGFAVQLCLARFPGRFLESDETPPKPVLNFLATQLGISPAAFDEYGLRLDTRREHARQIQRRSGLHPATRADRRGAMIAGITAASATDRGLPIAHALVNSFRQQGSLLPTAGVLDRLGLAARAIARQQAESALIGGYSEDHLLLFDELLAVDPALRQSRLGWLRNRPEAPGGQNLLKLIERLQFLRKIGVDPSRQGRIHPERWKQLTREGELTPSWLAADFNATRRRATIIAQVIELETIITDAAVAMFTKLLGRLFSRVVAERKQRYADNRKEMSAALRLFRDTLRALVAANEEGEDAFDALDREVGWHRLVQAKPTVEAMVEDASSDPLLSAAEKYRNVREYAAQFLNAFAFRSNRAHDPLLAAIALLKSLYQEGRRSLPEKVPVGHLTDHVRRLVRADSKNERRLYEIATLSVLREKLRSADIWVEGSRNFRSIQDYFMPNAEFVAAKDSQTLGLGVPQNSEAFLTEAMQTIDFRLKRLAYRARAGKLNGVRLIDGELIVTPLRSEVPPEVENLKWELHSLLPQVHITSLLMEENSWIRFTDRFTHVRTQDAVKSDAAILAALLADASNLGAKRMAEACVDISERQIMWARLFHVRPETYRAAQAAITDAHARHPHAQLWGTGTTSSSDGQFFRASDRGARLGDTNPKYSNEPGGKFYSHLSDQYGYFGVLPISPTESEAPYVLDGLLDHETILEIEEHYTDTGGASDHVFGLFALLGKRFAPRLRDLKGRRFHPFEKPGNYPLLKNHVGNQINVALIRECWDELLHLAVSLNAKTVAPSTMLKKLAASRSPSRLARALAEMGRIERTLFMIEWYSDPALRRRCQAGLNKGEAAHKLKRAVFLHERGEIRDRSYDSQALRASGLNLVCSAIIHWNTVYLARAVAHLRGQGRDIPDELLRHVSPLIWEHINLTGIYTWETSPSFLGPYRPLRSPPPADFEFVA